MRIVVLPLALAVAAAEPAWPQASGKPDGKPAVAEFMVGSQAFRLQLPKDYCLASAEQLRETRKLDQADPNGDTLVLATRCTGAASDAAHFAIVKSPRQYADSTHSLEQLLSSFPVESSLADQRVGAEYDKELGRQASEIRREKIELATAISPRGRDGRCGYLGGSLAVTTAEGTSHLTAGVCFTAVAGKIVMIAAYGPRGGDEAVKPLLVLASTIAAGIKPAP